MKLLQLLLTYSVAISISTFVQQFTSLKVPKLISLIQFINGIVLSTEAKYTAISRTTVYQYVNLMIDSIDEDLHDLPDTYTTLLQRRIAEKNRMNNKLYKRRKEAHSILMRIVHNPNTSKENGECKYSNCVS